MSLPNDYARCAGKMYVPPAMNFACLPDECINCKRREFPEDASRVWMMGTPEEYPCPARIAREES